jgi:hypothetical protein
MPLKSKMPEIVTVGDATESDLMSDDKVMTLAQQLAYKHGLIKMARESGGLHFYVASPYCLREYGEDELLPSKMHLAINVDKYLGRAPYTKSNDLCARCMKSGVGYKVSDLLNMTPLEERGYQGQHRQVQVLSIDDNKFFETDCDGNRIPKGPGVTIPITMLPENHVAVKYLKDRDFDPEKLYKQFRVSFCTKERSDMYYGKLNLGFRATPQNRLVFFIDMDGVQKGWQARVIDMKSESTDGSMYHFYFHPYSSKWIAVNKYDPDSGDWKPIDGVGKFDPRKYLLATKCGRSQLLMGYDVAIAYNKDKGTKWLGLTEGALDAARMGPPFCAVMGKHMSREQSSLCREFDKVVLAMQNDEASDELRGRVVSEMRNRNIPCSVIQPPDGYKDFGEMSQEMSDEILTKFKKEENLE